MHKRRMTQGKGYLGRLPYLITAIILFLFVWKITHTTKVKQKLISSMFAVSDKQIYTGPVSFPSFQAALESRSAPDKFIILSMLDMGALKMGLNFWETSLAPHEIHNYLFLSTSDETCRVLQGKMIPCYVYSNDTTTGKTSLYTSKEFIKKMAVRTDIVLDALGFGYTVLLTDVDMIWMGNPLEYRHDCPECDLLALWDHSSYNAGFVFIKPTTGSKFLYRKVQEAFKEETKLHEQEIFNKVITENTGKFMIKKLSKYKFMSGLEYFDHGRRNFAGEIKPCPICVVVHNNWIVSMEAKTYRFREMHYWVYDDDHYYSDCNRKYIKYNNPILFSNRKEEVEMNSLCIALAIGMILNRTVILPQFHHHRKGNSTLLDFILLRDFDKVFKDKYRESTFLDHQKIPSCILKSQSKPYSIESSLTTSSLSLNDSVIKLRPQLTGGASEEEILNWFRDCEESVLHFHSLYQAFLGFTDISKRDLFEKMIREGLKRGRYRQV